MKKKVIVFLFNGFSDWEIAYLAPEIMKSGKFDLIYFSHDGSVVISAGGLSVLPGVSLREINPDEVEMLVFPGGAAWETDKNEFLDFFVNDLFMQGKTIAAICGATAYLARKGFLNQVEHASNGLFYLKGIAPEYIGEKNYVDSLAVTDGNLITAKGIAPIEFAREIFVKLKLFDDGEIESWFQLFKNGVWNG